MKKKMINKIFQLVIGGISITLILYWYDWRLLVILMLFGWANNIMMGSMNK
jgi:hypothetical protein